MHHSSRRLFRIQGSRSWKMEVARVFLRLRVLGDTGPMIFCAYIRCSMYIYIVYNDYHIWLLYILYDYYILYMIIIYYIYMSTLIIWLIMIVCFVDFDFLTCLIIPHLEDSKVARMWSSEFTGRRLTLDMSANCFGPHYFFRRIRRYGSICFVIEFVWYIIYIFCLESSMGKGPLGTCFKGHFFIFFETRDAHCFDLTLFGCLRRRTSNAQ